MVTFIALYRGESVAHAEVLAVTADPEIIAEFAARLLRQPPNLGPDPVLAHKRRAARRALRTVRAEAADAAGVLQ